MPKLTANVRSINSAINGEPAVYAIEGHEGLYLDVHGNGYAAWRLRYRPRPKANQRWHTIASSARGVPFDEVALKASELLSALKLHGIDPKAQRNPADDAVRSVEHCFRRWLDHTGKRRGKLIAPRTRAGYEGLFKLHVAPHLGDIPISRLDRSCKGARAQFAPFKKRSKR